MNIISEKSRVIKIAMVYTDTGTFRVWDHGSVDMWNDDRFDWVALPDHISMQDEGAIRNEGIRKMREA